MTILFLRGFTAFWLFFFVLNNIMQVLMLWLLKCIIVNGVFFFPCFFKKQINQRHLWLGNEFCSAMLLHWVKWQWNVKNIFGGSCGESNQHPTCQWGIRDRDGSNGLTQHFDVTDLLSLVTIVPQADHYKVLSYISLNNLIKIPKYLFLSSISRKNKAIENNSSILNLEQESSP